MTLLEEARGLIKAHLAAKPHLSIASLAKACGMPPTTARAIVQGEVQKTSIDKITSLLLTFMDIESVIALIAKHEKAKVQSGALQFWAERKAKFIASEGFDWQDPDHEIVALAASPSGITAARISELYGKEHGEKRLSALLEAGILREINGRIRQPDENVSFSMLDAQKRAALHTDRWRPDDIEDGGFLYHLYLALTQEGQEEVRTLLKQLITDLGEIEKKYRGSDAAVLILSLCGTQLKAQL
jgi:chromosome segregation and condensation protein ScpB